MYRYFVKNQKDIHKLWEYFNHTEFFNALKSNNSILLDDTIRNILDNNVLSPYQLTQISKINFPEDLVDKYIEDLDFLSILKMYPGRCFHVYRFLMTANNGHKLFHVFGMFLSDYVDGVVVGDDPDQSIITI